MFKKYLIYILSLMLIKDLILYSIITDVYKVFNLYSITDVDKAFNFICNHN